MGLRDRTAVVTGGSGVIGSQIAVALADEGAHVVVGWHRNEERATEVAEQIRDRGGRCSLLQLDLTRPGTAADTLRRLHDDGRGTDILVHGAVVWPTPGAGPFEAVDVRTIRESVEANLVAAVELAQVAVASMRPRGWGRLLFLSTGLVEDGFAGSAAYTTAKAGLHGLTRTLSRELAATGILVNTVMPGYVPHGHEPSELLEQVRRSAATRATTTPADVAGLATYLCSGQNGAVTGELIRADGHFLTRD